MKEVLQLILIETSANCFTFSFLLPALGAQKEGLVLLTQLTPGAPHTGKTATSAIWGNSTIFHSELGKTATPGALPFTDCGGNNVNVTISLRDNYCIEIVLRCLAVEGDRLGSHQVNDGGVLGIVMTAGFKN